MKTKAAGRPTKIVIADDHTIFRNGLRRLLETERLSHSFAVSTALVDRIQQPIGAGSRRVAGLRLSDPRVLALLQALCSFSHLPLGFRNRDLRPQVAQLLGWDLARYSPGAMTYDLRRLRLHGLI